MFDYLEQFRDIDALAEPTTVGRRLDASGFVFGDPFDTFLRKISKQYLQETWSQLVAVLDRFYIGPFDLSWGWLHDGDTYIPESEINPLNYTGWTSLELAEFYEEEEKFSNVDQQLIKLTPKLRCGSTWRSFKWRIAPTDFDLGLRLIEYLCIWEGTDWSPDWILGNNPNKTDPWINIARAILNKDQAQLDLAFKEAKSVYSSLGFRIVVSGYTHYLEGVEATDHLQMPSLK